jgi:hypothetical protein
MLVLNDIVFTCDDISFTNWECAIWLLCWSIRWSTSYLTWLTLSLPLDLTWLDTLSGFCFLCAGPLPRPTRNPTKLMAAG